MERDIVTNEQACRACQFWFAPEEPEEDRFRGRYAQPLIDRMKAAILAACASENAWRVSDEAVGRASKWLTDNGYHFRGDSEVRAFLEAAVGDRLARAARMEADYASLEERERTWKDQAGRDQRENEILKAQLRGAHVTYPGTEEGDFTVPQLVQFMHYAATSAKEGHWGKWRAQEFESAANALDLMYKSYLAVCEHERILKSPACSCCKGTGRHGPDIECHKCSGVGRILTEAGE